MGKQLGAFVSDVNGMFEVYRSEDGEYSVYAKERSNGGRLKRQLLKDKMETREEAMGFCQNIIDRTFDGMIY